MGGFLEIDHLAVRYGNISAVRGISLQVEEGRIVALLGANGAGKSSTLRAISGLVAPASGKIRFNGEDITGAAAEHIVRLGISHCPEGRQIFPDLTVMENLRIGAFTQKSRKKIGEQTEFCLNLFPQLADRKAQMAGTLSGGEQQMLAIARAIMPSPRLLILDEPSLGLAPLIVRDIFRMIRKINEMGTTVLIVEQNALQTLKVADYAYVLSLGTVIMESPAKKLLENSELVNAYLGKS
ncbi:ABC transporter ATP-binding protein [Papillibacter cinnamivorans]|uniref:Branched-chain amino acid transport system ATP-binding protein n=1 Tax=Papillibacter cinnamivorans DSM 12816 TaxID=1122930 RepID=A0A1W2C2Y5_9FIRM|nr:ABC transporter ATP-binding protein [Papillibacter cinnamivorans]SMC79543.1 branched-chain amino acid transport system ATP-binding protein [Papillibacter cinnamivorans DSM 12816]